MAIEEGEVLAGFFYLSSRSNLTIERSIVKHLTGKTGAAVQLTTDSLLVSRRSHFKYLRLLDTTILQGAVVFA